MSVGDEFQWVDFQSPEHFIERLDAIADLLEKDRTDLLVEAMQEYIEEAVDSDRFQHLVAPRYYNDEFSFETVKELVDPETAQRFRLLKSDLVDGSFDVAAPDLDVDVCKRDAQMGGESGEE